MDLDEFVKPIIDILDDNNIDYFYKNVGHIKPIENDKAILYFSKDIMIFLDDNNCMIDIMFSLVDGTYYLKEMTIQVKDEEYGYKHCKIFDREKNKYREFSLNSLLNETNLRYVQDYIGVCIKYSNDKEALHNIWKKSFTRTNYKEKYPTFNIDKTTYINQKTYKDLENIFKMWDRLNERLFFFEDEQLEFKLIDDED